MPDPPIGDDEPGRGRFDRKGRVRAAGGIVWRRVSGGGGLEVAVVHRKQYDDWTFPKGKRDPGESCEQTAVREVEEETGLRCDLGPELASTIYQDGQGRTKVVRYWAMTAASGELQAHNEVDDARWVGTTAVRPLLTYERDRQVLDAFMRLIPQ